jgi:hypothetical protein
MHPTFFECLAAGFISALVVFTIYAIIFETKYMILSRRHTWKFPLEEMEKKISNLETKLAKMERKPVREDGLYLVKRNDYWHRAIWKNGVGWKVEGINKIYQDEDFDEIKVNPL